MSDPRPEFVYRFEKRGFFHFLFVLCCLLFAWVFVVLFGETQGWGEDPGTWAILPTLGWGLLALAVFAIFIAMALAQLVIRERPGQIYRLEGAAGAPLPPPQPIQGAQTLVTTPAEPTPEELPTTTAEAEFEPKPGQS